MQHVVYSSSYSTPITNFLMWANRFAVRRILYVACSSFNVYSAKYSLTRKFCSVSARSPLVRRSSGIFTRPYSDRAPFLARPRPPLPLLCTVLPLSSHSIGPHPFRAPSFHLVRLSSLRSCAVIYPSSTALAPFEHCSTPVFTRPCSVREPSFSGLRPPVSRSNATFPRFARHSTPVCEASLPDSRDVLYPSTPACALCVRHSC